MASLLHLSDNELLLLLKKGDESAFSEIYNRYWEKMASYSIRLTKSEDESADIVQEIFISLWRRKEDLVIKGSLAAYLIKSTRNLSLRYIERNINVTDFVEKLAEFISDKSQDIEENISFRELQEQIDKGVAKLPKKMQQIYLLSRDEQLSYREISEKLGISEGTVKKQISNSLKIISESLKGKLSITMSAILFHFLR
ncbi:RNA polymerase sigma-70 factor (ECF subfamily) [Pedobacter sp. W3I1]|uniref:RNA polymerase sigma factor n=1 Tax=Pedobacter sp. W3I1 TaxID=3042291 RepID=UPI00278815DC|nr:RNA polymerase sigma-70 factor [Pedobacter sp. W3I1]MDQ0641221.1 RNA polymerase sigma-70 factor (ECF subfamily) [Pedobacter sp. W3I1]